MNLLTGDIVEKFYTFLWPLTRIAAALMTVPILSVDAANARVRLMLALALTLLIFPMFTWPIIDPISSLGITTMFNQVGIGVMMGLTLQVITAAMIVAGQAISSAMGLSMSDAVRILLKRVVNDQAFPLELKVPNAATRAAMRESRGKIKAGKARFESAAQLIDDLEKTSKQ